MAVEHEESTPNRDCDDLELTSLVEKDSEETPNTTETMPVKPQHTLHESSDGRSETTPRPLETHFR